LVSSLELPEVYGFTGIVLFVILSIFTAIFDKHYPKETPYLYQAAALAGFGQLAYNSMNSYLQTRILLNLSYILFSLANVAGLFIWLLLKESEVSSLLKYSYLFLIMFPASLVVAFLYLGYLQPFQIPFSILSLEAFSALFTLLTSSLILEALATYKPEYLKSLIRFVSVKVKLNHKRVRGEI